MVKRWHESILVSQVRQTFNLGMNKYLVMIEHYHPQFYVVTFKNDQLHITDVSYNFQYLSKGIQLRKQQFHTN